MHGDVNHPAEAILCKDDYESYHQKNGPFLIVLSGDLVAKTFVFLGFSFSDPNLDYVLSRLKLEHANNQNKHYCLLRREQAIGDEDSDDLAYRIVKQELFIKDLQNRYNIRTILIDKYEEITEIFKKIEERFKHQSVFVSGSATTYGSNWSEDEALNFLQLLGQELIKKEYKIVSGLAWGLVAH